MTNTFYLNNFNNSLDINQSFNYNFYEKNETQTKDDTINNKKNSYNSKEINVQISFKNYDILDEKSFLYRRQININGLKSLNNKSLTRSEIDLFNDRKPRRNTIEKNYDIKESFLLDIVKNFNINQSNLNLAEAFTESKKIFINVDVSEKLKNINNDNYFFDNSILDIFEVEEESYNMPFFEDTNLLSEYKVFSKKSIYNSDRQITYFTHVGFLVEKFLKENKKIKVTDTRFFLNKLDNNNEFLEANENFSLKDVNIKYGKTYCYRIFPVYNITIPKYRDFHVLEDFLVCDTPYYSDEVLCKEFVPPKPPSNISFTYENSKIVLRWVKPADTVNDVKGYQIFKRYSLDEPFVLVKQIEYHLETDFYERNNNINEINIEKRLESESLMFIDELIKGVPVIYTICSIDAHGLTSNYSAQIGCLLNQENMKIQTDLVSSEGAPLYLPNILIKRKTKFFNNEDKYVTVTPAVRNMRKFTIYATPDFHSINRNNGDIFNLYKENYKINIFKLENNENFIDNIQIINFNN